MQKRGLTLFLVLLCANAVCAQHKITAEDARDHVGEKVVVCGKVASEHFAATTKGQPTFINLDQPYPHQIFTIVIWGSDRPAFSEIPSKLCVTGTISLSKGVPEIIARSPSQIARN